MNNGVGYTTEPDLIGGYSCGRPDGEVLVLGNGPSVLDYPVGKYKNYLSVGANEISRLFDPDHVMALDPLKNIIRAEDPNLTAIRRGAMHSQIYGVYRRHWIEHDPDIIGAENMIEMRINSDWANNWDAFEEDAYEDVKATWDKWKPVPGGEFLIPGFEDTGMVCFFLALALGAKRIYLVGIDYTDGKFFRNDNYSHKREVTRFAGVDYRWASAVETAERLWGCETINCSKKSLLTGIQKGELP